MINDIHAPVISRNIDTTDNGIFVEYTTQIVAIKIIVPENAEIIKLGRILLL
jgi:hypothetical protein